MGRDEFVIWVVSSFGLDCVFFVFFEIVFYLVCWVVLMMVGFILNVIVVGCFSY